MGIEIRIPKEIDDYREKWYFRRTKRELAWGAGACSAALCTGLSLFHVGGLSLDASTPAAFSSAVPFAVMGFARPLGLPLETYLRYYLDQAFGTRKLPYKTELPADDKFPIRMGQMTKRERRDYAKSLSKEDRRALRRQSERETGRLEAAEGEDAGLQGAPEAGAQG